MPSALEAPCPLCHLANPASCTSQTSSYFHHDKQRIYLRCQSCHLVYVPPQYHLSFEEQKCVYDQHENHAEHTGYRHFLSRLLNPLLTRLPSSSSGLDFGCGPSPVLAGMIQSAGHHVTLYDPLYANNPAVLHAQYDFITATEVIEHVFDPARELNTLWNCLRPNGILALMTKLVKDQNAFTTWHYIRDITHINFFSPETFQWLSQCWHTECEFIGADVMLFRKMA
ncbi:MAG: class I SAM-dependent methyltransferase [Gammaproteobacteria bacterium]